MVEVAAFLPADVDALQLQPQQAAEMEKIADWRAMVRAAATLGPAWTGRIGGQVVGCAGLSLAWKGRAHAWCVLGDGIPARAWPGIHKAVAARLDQMQMLDVWRIEAETAYQFRPGARWLAMLGFELEGVARGYGPDRRDFLRFARVTL